MALNYQYPTTNQTQISSPTYPQIGNLPSFFPQPIGNVYSLNTANEIGNIPAGTGVSIGLCLQEGVMYVKSLQNGAPMLLEYKLNSTDAPKPAGANNEEIKQVVTALKQLETKISTFEAELEKMKKGGKLEWQI